MTHSSLLDYGGVVRGHESGLAKSRTSSECREGPCRPKERLPTSPIFRNTSLCAVIGRFSTKLPHVLPQCTESEGM
jgi:hypothetical protein